MISQVMWLKVSWRSWTHVSQILCLIRLLPVLAYGAVDVLNPARQLYILLREIVELMCAPKISSGQICFLNHLVQQYVEERTDILPNVRLCPKHHYLLHYPWYGQYGPAVWTSDMRCEWKASILSSNVVLSHNFVNVTNTLADAHQLSQAYLSSSSGSSLCGLTVVSLMICCFRLVSAKICVTLCNALQI